MKGKNRVKGPEYYDRIYKTSPRYQMEPHGVQTLYYEMYRRCRGSILEIGCGTGQFAKWVHKKHPYVLGIDFSEEAIRQSKKRCPKLKFIHGDIFEHPGVFKRDYGTVFMCEVLEHIPEDQELMGMIPIGKRVVFSVPNYDALGHIRWFESVTDAEERYKESIRIIDNYQIGKDEGRAIYIIVGMRR